MVVLAHPDDETLFCGGLLARAAASGLRVVTVTLTRGESGRTLGVCREDELPQVREHELRAATAELGVAETKVFGFPDGSLSQHEAEAVKCISELAETVRPRVLILFPPNGLNGHPDHVAAHRIALSAFRHRQAVELLFMADDSDFTEPARPGYLAPVEVNRLRRPANLVVDIGQVTERKLCALGHYETQARSVTKFLRLHPRRLLQESFHWMGGQSQTSAFLRSFTT